MEELGLVVVGAVLSALLARTWGHRRLLQHVHEQLTVLRDMPDNWGRQRRALEDLADRDMARYLRQRNPSFPIHRLMDRFSDVGVVGIAAFTLAQAGHVPESEAVRNWISAAGLTLLAVSGITNLIIFLTRRADIKEELDASAGRAGNATQR